MRHLSLAGAGAIPARLSDELGNQRNLPDPPADAIDHVLRPGGGGPIGCFTAPAMHSHRAVDQLDLHLADMREIEG